MAKTDSTGTAELADLRPSEGEYFYTDAHCLRQYHGESSFATCFVCGLKTFSSGIYHHIHAIAQCLAAGKRIAAIFKPEACYGPTDACLRPGVKVIISACETHQHCAQILCRLTTDGIITLGRVSRAEKALISRSEFIKLVDEAAYEIWKTEEPDRRNLNWYDSWELCLRELKRIPSFAERKEWAKRLWQERKDAQAMEDWLKAEKGVAALYTVDDIVDAQ